MGLNEQRLKTIKEKAEKNQPISELDVKWIQKTVNAYGYKSIFDYEEGLELPLMLTDEQIQKGFKWLWNKYKTPTGKIRKTNPFGFREIEILKKFKTIELYGIHSVGYGNNCVLSYCVIAEEDGQKWGFEYYVLGGGISIVG